MSKLNKEPVEIKQQIDLDTQVMVGLKTAYTKAIQTEKVLLETRKSIFEKNNKLTMLPGVPKSQRLSNLVTDISQGYGAISAAHTKYIAQLESNVSKPLNDYPVKAKDLKTAVIAYEAKKKVFDKEKIAASRSLKNATVLTKAETEYGAKETELLTKLQTYQHEKISNLKQILLDSMNAEMYYHAQALERLSDLAHRVYNIDSTKEAEDIIRDLITVPPPQGQGQSQYKPPLNQSQNAASQQKPLNPLQALAQDAVSQQKPLNPLQASAQPQPQATSTQLQGQQQSSQIKPPLQAQSQALPQSSMTQSQTKPQQLAQSSAQP